MEECVVILSCHSDLDFWVVKLPDSQYAPTTLLIKWRWVSQFIMTLIWHPKMVPMGPFYMAECVVISSSHCDLAFWVVKVLNSQYALTTLHKVGMGVPICQDPYLTPQNGSYGSLPYGLMRGYIKFSLWPQLLSGQTAGFTICTNHITLSGHGCPNLSWPLSGTP